MASGRDITLGQLLDRAISSYDHILEQPVPNDESVQTEILSALADLSLSASLISRLAILSTNETLEDINTKDLKCLAVDALRGVLETLIRTKGGGERKKHLEQAKNYLNAFSNQMETYEIIPSDQINQFKGPSSMIANSSIRRESKINQFKLEKQLKQQLEELRERQRSSRQSRLRGSSTAGGSKEEMAESDDEDDTESRSIYLTWLKFLYLKTHQELSIIEMELDILGQAAQMNDLPTKNTKTPDEDLSWRLDKLASARDGPLVSPSGKVLRPFTIIPSQSSSSSSSASTARIRLREEVFRPDWNLPTMTIDEYLDEQRAMGNFLSGGGPNQSNQQTPGERAQLEAQEDNLTGEAKAEELRKKAIEWDEFTDTHRKGEGNMLNRG